MHRITPLPFKPPHLEGLSERLLASRYENNCGGAVRRLNAIERRLDELDWGQAPKHRHANGEAGLAVPGDGIAAEDLVARLQRRDDLVVLDICLAEDLAKRSDMIPGAQLRTPELIADWAGELPKDKPIVAYCVYGFRRLRLPGQRRRRRRASSPRSRRLHALRWHCRLARDRRISRPTHHR